MNSEASWLKDGVEAIDVLSRKASSVTPTLLNLPLEKAGTYAIVMPGSPGAKIEDAIQVKVAKPKWHNELLETPDNLVAFIESREGVGEAAGGLKSGGVVFVGQTGIVYCYDAEDRRDRASTPLTLSKPWQWLASDTKPMDQRTIIRTLRILFGGALPQGSDLITRLRSLKFQNDGTVDVNIQHGSNKLGKNILSAVTGVDAIPEDFTLFVNIFENFAMQVPIRCALEITPERQVFEVIPYPNEMQRAMETTLEAIRTKFAATSAPAYLGAVRAGKVADD